MTEKNAKAGSGRTVRRIIKRKHPGGRFEVILRDGKGRSRAVYSFGGAVLKSSKGHTKVSAETLEQSRKAMRELGDRLLKPGVKIPERRGIPKFYADETDPAFVVRELEGERERGKFENGQFKAVV
jgi:hypothetical protein